MNKYNREEVYKSTLEYFNGDELAANVWIDKYCLKDSENNYYEINPTEMHHRITKEFYKIEEFYRKCENIDKINHSEYGKIRKNLSYNDIYNLFDNFRYIVPQGSIMSMLGDKLSIGSLSNCVVIPELYDSYGGIMYADQQLVQLMKRRCGVGLDISTLRPENSPVTNAAKSSTGPISFMERFSNSTREVALNNRRGALMITMDINHPDVEKFVIVKSDLKKITGANISLKITDEFMNAVENDTEFELKFPTHSNIPLVSKKIKAKDFWKIIIKQANSNAEPGLIFWDRQHWYSPSSVYPEFINVSTNPCAEIAMGADSCRLIALNMYNHVENPFTDKSKFNYELWYKNTYEAQRLMDDLVDLELESVERILEKIKNDEHPDYIKDIESRTWKTLYETGKNGRRTGLGFTALADTLSALNIKYDSKEALEIVEKIMKTKCEAEFDSSIDMAIERGQFQSFDPQIENTSHFIQMIQQEFPFLYERMIKFGRRNVSISTIAPSGSISLLTQTTSGIEPVFMISYKRRKKITENIEVKVDFVDELGDKWQEYEIFHPKLKDWMRINNSTNIENSPYYNCTAHDIDWKIRIQLQAICQKYITHSISSTINLKSDTKDEIVSQIYFESWKKGLKGITIYRDGSRTGVLVDDKKKKDVELIIKENNAPKRPKILECDVIKFKNKGKEWIGFVGLLNNSPYEIFTGQSDSFIIPSWVEKGKIIKIKGGDKDGSNRYDFVYIDKDGYDITIPALNRAFDPEYWNTAKLISAVLRHGMPIPSVINLIDTLKMDNYIGTWLAGVKRMLKKYIKDESEIKDSDKTCPQCGEKTLIYQSGCVICMNEKCGWSKC